MLGGFSMNNDKEKKIDNRIEELKKEFNTNGKSNTKSENDEIFSENVLESESKLYEQITKEIKKRILKTVLKTIAVIAIIATASVFIINPVIKSMYPDFVGLSTSSEKKYLKNASLYDNIQYWIFKTMPIGFNKYDEPDKLSELVYSFYNTTQPFTRSGLVEVIDNHFGDYQFIVNTVSPNVSSMSNSRSNVIQFKRGNTIKDTNNNYYSDFYFPASYYETLTENNKTNDNEHNKKIIESIKNLPDSAVVSASIFTKNVESVRDITIYMKKNYPLVNMFWMPVVDTVVYNKIENIYKSKSENLEDYRIFQLGISVDSQMKYQSNLNSLYDQIENYSEEKIKDIYLDNLNKITNNPTLFFTFCDFSSVIPHYEKINSSFGSAYSVGFEFNSDKELYENVKRGTTDHYYYTFNEYLENIRKSDKIQTHSFTATLQKNELLRLLNDDRILTANIMSVNMSEYPQQ